MNESDLEINDSPAVDTRARVGAASSGSRPYIGGQAVIEGVMMRSPQSISVVVRRADGSLSVHERACVSMASGIWRWPFFRGVGALVESVSLGSEALRFSSELYEQDHGGEPPKAAGSNVSRALATFHSRLELLLRTDTEPTGEARTVNWFMILTLVLVVSIFFFLPQASAYFAASWLHVSSDVHTWRFQLLTGSFKLALVLGYLLAIRQVSEIRRVFQYHGAEHKAVSTYESGKELSVDYARPFTTLHARCGTTFLVLTVLVSVILWIGVGAALPKLSDNKYIEQLLFFLIKLPLIPPLAGLTYELQRLTARYCMTGPLRIFLWPGFLVQKITTISPDDSQLEVALAALRVALWRHAETAQKQAAHAPLAVVHFADFDALMASEATR